MDPARSRLKKAFQFLGDAMLGTGKVRPAVPNSLTVCEPTVCCLVPRNGIWAPVATYATTPSVLFEHYLDPTAPSEEVLAAAILVHGNGKPWNTTRHSEEFFHIESWLSAVTALLEGAPSAFIWAWEETGMTAWLQGDQIVLEERTHHISFQLPSVCFELRRFARELAQATQGAVELISGLKQVAREAHAAKWRTALKKRVRSITRDLSTAPQPDWESGLAELRAAEQRSLKEAQLPGFRPVEPTQAQVRKERLEEVLEYLAAEKLSTSWQKFATVAGFVT
jgi:hypothetical protein